MRANGFPICPLNNESEWVELDGVGVWVGGVCVCMCVFELWGDWCSQGEEERQLGVLVHAHSSFKETKSRPRWNTIKDKNAKWKRSFKKLFLFLLYNLFYVSWLSPANIIRADDLFSSFVWISSCLSPSIPFAISLIQDNCNKNRLWSKKSTSLCWINETEEKMAMFTMYYLLNCFHTFFLVV